jgi:hypothetical protein
MAAERQDMTMQLAASDNPPRWMEGLLRLLLKRRDRDTIVGDLLEEYREVIVPTRSRFRADLWYLRHALSLIDGVTLGTMVGIGFGTWNLIYTQLAPLAEDTPLALTIFYGPMFGIWGVAACSVFRRTGEIREAVKVGATVGCVTFLIFDAAVLLRANLFLDAVAQRSDWQGLIMDYERSGWSSFRLYVNYVYVTGIPTTILLATIVGATVGLIGGLAGTVGRQRAHPLPSR